MFQIMCQKVVAEIADAISVAVAAAATIAFVLASCCDLHDCDVLSGFEEEKVLTGAILSQSDGKLQFLCL